MIHGMHTGTHAHSTIQLWCARVCVKIRRGACALLGVCTREHKDRSIGMCARARVCVCARGRGCRPPGLLPPPQLHHRSNVTGAKASGEGMSARARAGWLADEIWQQRFCFRHGFNVRRRCTYTRQTGRPAAAIYIYIYILLLQSINCGSTGDVWPSVRDWNRK